MKNGIYYSPKHNKDVVVYKEIIPTEGLGSYWCSCCGKDLTKTAYSVIPCVHDEFTAEDYYGSECINKLGLKKV